VVYYTKARVETKQRLLNNNYKERSNDMGVEFIYYLAGFITPFAVIFGYEMYKAKRENETKQKNKKKEE
jgi:hypothetical protein